MPPAALSLLQDRLSYSFKDPGLLRRAMTHKSYLNEHRKQDWQDNERLEFLGDSVLDLVIGRQLMEQFPDASEGSLSKMKANIVSEESLAKIAEELDLGAFLFLGKGERKTQGMKKPSLLSDALEALIAALYLDGGLEASAKMVLRHFEAPLKGLDEEQLFDYKTTLQEQAQKAFKSLPVYRMRGETGPDHDKAFEIEVLVAGRPCGSGIGKTKKSAEQQAAKAALKAFSG